MLPDLDGWGVLKAMRTNGVNSAVLMLTAREAVEDRVMGLESGADDYLCKPFAFTELLARIRTLLRRASREPQREIEFEGVRLDAKRHRVTRNEVPVDLTAKEFQLLDLLLQHRGEVLSKVFISEHLWDMNFDSDSNVLEVHMGRLRAKVDGPYDRKILHTVRGRGYVVR
ncbi:DNA-binding heavy metal response regulator [alpha proteobacterium U9-1i]|nr:DNA-binding heavy metal response regulator [alpha proteobacterium U9-1i]